MFRLTPIGAYSWEYFEQNRLNPFHFSQGILDTRPGVPSATVGLKLAGIT